MKLISVIIYCAALISLATTESASATTPQKDSDSQPPISKEDVLAVRSFTAPSVGQFHVVLRKGGHQRKLPFLFELRPTCGGTRRKWDRVSVASVESSCDADSKTIKYDAGKGEVSIKVRNVDWAGFDKKSRELGTDKAGEPECKKEWETSVLKLSDVCQK